MDAFLEFVAFGEKGGEDDEDSMDGVAEDTEVSEDPPGAAPASLFEDTAPPIVGEDNSLSPNPFLAKADTELPESLPSPQPGATIHDRYTVDSLLGDGAFGQVFKVQHRMLGQVFALKTLGSRIGRDPNIVAQFVAEAKATSLIGHENIVFVTDFGVCPIYGHYLVMEYLDGSTLEKVLEDEGVFDIDTAIDVAHSVGNALSAVHELGIVHRDLKPPNIMRATKSHRQVWKVVDFGISTAVSKSGLTGTPSYMPPEQALGQEVDGRADQFSLAVIVFEMLTGELPWSTRSWLDALADARREQGVPRISDLRPEVPQRVSDVVRRAMSIDADDRFDSIEDFVVALKQATDQVHQPTIDPFDVRETTRHLEQGTEPDERRIVGEAFGPTQSVITHVSDVSVDVRFQSLARFKREYRRNIVAGGLFVPTNRPLPVRSFSLIRLSVNGYDPLAEFACTVVSNDDGSGDSPPGFGVSLDDSALKRLQTFLESLESGFDTSPDAPIRVRKGLDEVKAGITAAQAFFLSRIDAQMTVGRARAMFATLPFDFEDTIQSLIDSGHIIVGVALEEEVTQQRPMPIRTNHYSPEQLAMILERADYFESQHNYLGARELLDEAVRHAPNSAALHHRLARLQLRFEGNVSGAHRSVQRALEIEPENADYRATGRLVSMIQKRRG